MTLVTLVPLACVALVHALASRDPIAVERLYSLGLYAYLARPLAAATGRVPFSVAEALVLVALASTTLSAGLWAARLARARGRRLRMLARGLLALVAAASWLYLVFLAVWGLHYQREPLARSMGLDTRPAAVSELAALCGDLVARANGLRPGLPEDARGVMRLSGGLDDALRRAESGYRELARQHPFLEGRFSRPKAVWLSRALSHLGISGMFFPFTGEANVNATLPDPDVPFTICHEMAHQRGYAREDEASFLGYLACRLHPDADFRYSGALAASAHALKELAQQDRETAGRLAGERQPAVRRDLEALRAWSERYRGRATRAGRAINDAYLRSQGDPRGVASYGRLVDLLIAERRTRLLVPPEPRGACPGKDGDTLLVENNECIAISAWPFPDREND